MNGLTHRDWVFTQYFPNSDLYGRLFIRAHFRHVVVPICLAINLGLGHRLAAMSFRMISDLFDSAIASRKFIGCEVAGEARLVGVG